MAKSIPRSCTLRSLTKITYDDLEAKISRKILKVKVYTPICKPLNGSLPSSKISHLLKLSTFDYQYNVGKETKTSNATAYLIKGLRGALRHQVLALCKDRGIEVCHSSDKETDQQGNSLLSEGFHLQRSCLDKNECIVHSVFGSKRHTSKISISALPISNISHKTYHKNINVQNVHIATEKRVALAFEGKSIQDFGERYFAGEFEFEIDVSKCTAEETGMIIEAAMYIQKLGGGYNAGYGKLQVQNLKLVKSTTIREPRISEKGDFTIEEQINEEAIPGEFTEALTKWNKYLKDMVAQKREE